MKEKEIISVSEVRISYIKREQKSIAGFTVSYSDGSMKNIIKEIGLSEDAAVIKKELEKKAEIYISKIKQQKGV